MHLHRLSYNESFTKLLSRHQKVACRSGTPFLQDLRPHKKSTRTFCKIKLPAQSAFTPCRSALGINRAVHNEPERHDEPHQSSQGPANLVAATPLSAALDRLKEQGDVATPASPAAEKLNSLTAISPNSGQAGTPTARFYNSVRQACLDLPFFQQSPICLSVETGRASLLVSIFFCLHRAIPVCSLFIQSNLLCSNARRQ